MQQQSISIMNVKRFPFQDPLYCIKHLFNEKCASSSCILVQRQLRQTYSAPAIADMLWRFGSKELQEMQFNPKVIT